MQEVDHDLHSQLDLFAHGIEILPALAYTGPWKHVRAFMNKRHSVSAPHDGTQVANECAMRDAWTGSSFVCLP